MDFQGRRRDFIHAWRICLQVIRGWSAKILGSLWKTLLLRHFLSEKNFKILCFSQKRLKIFFLHGPECPGLANTEAFHQPAVLLAGGLSDLGCVTGPAESSAVQAHVKQYKTCFIMIQSLDAVGFPAAEKIQCICIRAHLVGIPDYRHKTIDRKPQIRAAALSQYSDNAAYPHDIFILIFSDKSHFFFMK